MAGTPELAGTPGIRHPIDFQTKFLGKVGQIDIFAPEDHCHDYANFPHFPALFRRITGIGDAGAMVFSPLLPSFFQKNL
jgi:hypothetical protein